MFCTQYFARKKEIIDKEKLFEQSQQSSSCCSNSSRVNTTQSTTRSISDKLTATHIDGRPMVIPMAIRRSSPGRVDSFDQYKYAYDGYHDIFNGGFVQPVVSPDYVDGALTLPGEYGYWASTGYEAILHYRTMYDNHSINFTNDMYSVPYEIHNYE